MADLSAPARRALAARAWLAAFFLLPSLHLAHKYGGWLGVAAATLAIPAGLLLLPAPRPGGGDARRRALWAWVALAALMALLYPLADAGLLGGGSDADDALDLAATRLLHGHATIYAERTYLGNPVTPLPGAVLLAAPFVMLGASALQNLFWLPWLVRLQAADGDGLAPALRLAGLTALLCPAMLHVVVTGGDYLANAIFVLVALRGLVRARGGAAQAGWAAFLGVALSSRPNFLPLALPALALVAARAGGWAGLGSAALTAGAGAAVTLPFYLVDPAGFTPLHVANKLGQFAAVLPHADRWVGGSTFLVALVLACRLRRTSNDVMLWRAGAWLLALPVVAALALSALQAGQPDFALAGYGCFALPFALAGWGRAAFPSPRAPATGGAGNGGSSAREPRNARQPRHDP